MTKFYRLVEIAHPEIYQSGDTPLVILVDHFQSLNSVINEGENKIDFSLHLENGSVAVCNLKHLINGVELAL